MDRFSYKRPMTGGDLIVLATVGFFLGWNVAGIPNFEIRDSVMFILETLRKW